MNTLIADCGSTKSEWCLVQHQRKYRVDLPGISPYFMKKEELVDLLNEQLCPALGNRKPDRIFYYGTGCANPANAKMVAGSLRKVFPGAQVAVTHDLMGAARALCGHQPGVACILGTGSNSCYYNGKKITKNSPGLGYVLGDEGSGAYLGRKVLQYYLYQTFDEELRYRFDAKYATSKSEVLESVYQKPMPNRYLASYAIFLAENRGHYMVENILEDGLNDFFFTHLCKYGESWKTPIHFIGSVAYGFRDVIKELAQSYEFELGNILQKPMDGLIAFHR